MSMSDTTETAVLNLLPTEKQHADNTLAMLLLLSEI